MSGKVHYWGYTTSRELGGVWYVLLWPGTTGSVGSLLVTYIATNITVEKQSQEIHFKKVTEELFACWFSVSLTSAAHIPLSTQEWHSVDLYEQQKWLSLSLSACIYWVLLTLPATQTSTSPLARFALTWSNFTSSSSAFCALWVFSSKVLVSSSVLW